MNDMDVVNKGRKFVIIIGIINMASEFLTVVLGAIEGVIDGHLSTVSMIQDTIRVMLTCLLLFFIYIGHVWARIVMTVLICLALVIGLLAAIYLQPLTLALIIPDIVILILILSNPVKVYQEYMRNKKKAPPLK